MYIYIIVTVWSVAVDWIWTMVISTSTNASKYMQNKHTNEGKWSGSKVTTVN